jgi:glycosyltransferase involved in cell wall biosynthesis
VSFILDMTPTAINRTAIFHIVLDTARAWRNRGCSYRYGDNVQGSLLETAEALNAIKPGILQLVLGDNGLIREAKRPFGMRRPRPANGRMVFFDPLYVLVDEIRANDIVLVLDISPLTNPEWHDGRVCELYRLAYNRLAMSGAKILSISRHTTLSLWANFGIDPRDVTEIPLYTRNGVKPVMSRAGDVEKRFLFVGSLELRKNIIGLMLAFERSKLAAQGFELSIVGGQGRGAEEITSVAAGIKGVHLHGFLPDEELQHLYRTSMAFVYPSYLEGFGVPLLEAMAWGLPILTATTGATAELAADAALLVDPHDVTAISDGLLQLAGMSERERQTQKAASRTRAAAFTFDRYLSAMETAVFGAEKDTAQEERRDNSLAVPSGRRSWLSNYGTAT